MGIRRINTANLNNLATRLKSESAAYWTGYDVKLVDELSSSVNQLTEEYNTVLNAFVEHKAERIHEIWRPVVTLAIVLASIIGFTGFCIYAGTHFRNFREIAKQEVRAEMTIPKQDLETALMSQGYQKVIIKEKINGYNKSIIIWEKVED